MFKDLKRQVRANFDKMAKDSDGVLFYTQISKDKMWDEYLGGFEDPAEKQGHNCNCCKSFLRQYAGVVSIDGNNKRISIWDNIEAPELFVQAVENMKNYIHSLPITDIFYTDSKHCGTDSNRNGLDTITWSHFYFMAPAKMVKGSDIDSLKGKFRTKRKQFERALEQITPDAIGTVIELIAQGSLYRGNTYKHTIDAFKEAQTLYNTVDSAEEKVNWTWRNMATVTHVVISIRNSSIGTLLVNLSESMDLDTAVRKFEKVVAPTNYKRPTALVTPGMINSAQEKLTELGLVDSLERRYALPTDLSAEDFLFVDRSSELKSVFDEMKIDSQKLVNVRTLKKVEEITIEKFINDVLPTAKSVELLLENPHLSKMVSLITGENKDAESLFQWNNLFSWSYTGGITDSIKERVKAAGGQVTGELRISLSWYNFDDLDLHVVTPDGFKIYYPRECRRHSATGGNLDVDMNAGSGKTREGVENIIFPNKQKMIEGVYEVRVNQFAKRELVDAGFDIQIEHDGNITDMHFPLSPRDTDVICKITYSKSKGITFDRDVESKVSTKKKWGISTNSFIKVKHMLLSPNYWGTNSTGNKHFMFMLENCINDEVARPFFNEFLKSEFNENRKVFEIMGAKMKVAPSQDQLSGVGFSETIASEVILRVEGKFKRLLKIKF